MVGEVGAVNGRVWGKPRETRGSRTERFGWNHLPALMGTDEKIWGQAHSPFGASGIGSGFAAAFLPLVFMSVH